MTFLAAVQAVTTPLTLVAFALAVFFSAYKIWLGHRRKVIASLPATDRAEVVAKTLRLFHIDTTRLSRTQQYDLALEQIRAREKRFALMVVLAVPFTVTFAAVALLRAPTKTAGTSPKFDDAAALFMPQPDGYEGQRAKCAREKNAYFQESFDRRSEGLPPLPQPQCDPPPAKQAWKLAVFFTNSGEAAAEDVDLFIYTPSTGILERNLGRVATGVRPQIEFDNLNAASSAVTLCISWLKSPTALAREWAIFSKGNESFAEYVPKTDDGTFPSRQDGCREKIRGLGG